MKLIYLTGEKILLAKAVGEEKDAVADDVMKHHGEADAARANIQNMQKGLKMAEQRVSRAHEEVYRLHSLPSLYEPSYYEELREARRLVPETDAPQIGKHNHLSKSLTCMIPGTKLNLIS
jgi:hypothetical protein